MSQVAERAHVPLISISAAGLGTDPSEVEDNLNGAFDMCSLWNAMLLLDEADVFLGARSGTDLARNELVAGELSYASVALTPWH